MRLRRVLPLLSFLPCFATACASAAPDPSTARANATSLENDGFALAEGRPADHAGVVPPSSGALLSLATTTSGGVTRGVAFFRDDASVLAYRPDGAIAWKRATANLGIATGPDWDDDGVRDVVVVERTAQTTPVTCIDANALPTATTANAPYTQLHLWSGRTGALLYSANPLPDFCFARDGKPPVLVPQWTESSVLASVAERTLAIAPTYAQQGFVLRRSKAGATDASTLVYPGNPAFGATYPDAKPVVPGTDRKDWPNAHVWNGLFSGSTLAFFTSGRAAGFQATSSGLAPLSFDVPFQPSGVTEGDGRNYGLVALDPASPLLALVGGCSVVSLATDMQRGVRGSDGPCGIHRHFTLVDVGSRSLRKSSFFSYANHGGDGASDFVDRITYPANPVVRTDAGASSFVYNSFAANGRWYLHASTPGTTDDLWRVEDAIVWDVVDVDGDGVDELFLSRTHGYEAEPTTIVAHVQGGALVHLRELPGALPLLVPSAKRDAASSSETALFSVVRDPLRPTALFMWDGKKTLGGSPPRFAVDVLTGEPVAVPPAPPPPAPEPRVEENPCVATATTCAWVEVQKVDIACQYPSQGPSGAQRSGQCDTAGAENRYEWGTGVRGGCVEGTFLRQAVTQRCTVLGR